MKMYVYIKKELTFNLTRFKLSAIKVEKLLTFEIDWNVQQRQVPISIFCRMYNLVSLDDMVFKE